MNQKSRGNFHHSFASTMSGCELDRQIGMEDLAIKPPREVFTSGEVVWGWGSQGVLSGRSCQVKTSVVRQTRSRLFVGVGFFSAPLQGSIEYSNDQLNGILLAYSCGSCQERPCLRIGPDGRETALAERVCRAPGQLSFGHGFLPSPFSFIFYVYIIFFPKLLPTIFVCVFFAATQARVIRTCLFVFG